MEYYSASKKQKKILTQAAARMNIKDMTLGKTSLSQKDRHRVISLTRGTRVVQYTDRKQNGCCQGLGEGGGEGAFSGATVSIWEDKKVLEVGSGDGHTQRECAQHY